MASNIYGMQRGMFAYKEMDPEDILDSYQSLNGVDSNCTAEKSVLWIYDIFGQCILSNLEMVGFFFGLLSIVCWMCSTIPQLVLNCRSGNADKALSFYFLGLARKICSLLGTLLEFDFTHHIGYQLQDTRTERHKKSINFQLMSRRIQNNRTRGFIVSLISFRNKKPGALMPQSNQSGRGRQRSAKQGS